jgi:hypothetical protein
LVRDLINITFTISVSVCFVVFLVLLNDYHHFLA